MKTLCNFLNNFIFIIQFYKQFICKEIKEEILVTAGRSMEVN